MYAKRTSPGKSALSCAMSLTSKGALRRPSTLPFRLSNVVAKWRRPEQKV